jgi:hypothetical protein
MHSDKPLAPVKAGVSAPSTAQSEVREVPSHCGGGWGDFVAGRVHPIAHHVNDHAGDGDVHPDGPGPSRYPAMLFEVTVQRTPQSGQHQGDDREGENDVRDENREVDRPDDSMALKAHVADMVVVGQIGHEEGGGYDERTQHARAMRAHPSPPDADIANRQKDGGDAVEDRVKRGERIIIDHSRNYTREKGEISRPTTHTPWDAMHEWRQMVRMNTARMITKMITKAGKLRVSPIKFLGPDHA